MILVYGNKRSEVNAPLSSVVMGRVCGRFEEEAVSGDQQRHHQLTHWTGLSEEPRLMV